MGPRARTRQRPVVLNNNTPNGADPEVMDDDDLVVFIGILTDRLQVHEQAAETIRSARARAFREGRNRTPPVIQQRMADAAGGMTAAAVISAIKKLERDEAG